VYTLFRHSAGFDRMQQLMNTKNEWDSNAQTYPPYNIEQINKNAYKIPISVAGFSEKDLNITAKENTLYLTSNLDGETLKM
jgi:molecular chaperone IbpA